MSCQESHLSGRVVRKEFRLTPLDEPEGRRKALREERQVSVTMCALYEACRPGALIGVGDRFQLCGWVKNELLQEQRL